jgi:hypothetical protein
MPRVEFEGRSEQEIARIYIAGSVAEAEAVEILLSEHGMDYSIELEEFIRSGFNLLSSTHVGATFYVLSDQAEFCRTLLKGKGLTSGIQEDSPA